MLEVGDAMQAQKFRELSMDSAVVNLFGTTPTVEQSKSTRRVLNARVPNSTLQDVWRPDRGCQ